MSDIDLLAANHNLMQENVCLKDRIAELEKMIARKPALYRRLGDTTRIYATIDYEGDDVLYRAENGHDVTDKVMQIVNLIRTERTEKKKGCSECTCIGGSDGCFITSNNDDSTIVELSKNTPCKMCRKCILLEFAGWLKDTQIVAMIEETKKKEGT